MQELMSLITGPVTDVVLSSLIWTNPAQTVINTVLMSIRANRTAIILLKQIPHQRSGGNGPEGVEINSREIREANTHIKK